FDRFGFYDHMKTLTAAPPDVLRVDEKHMREHSVANVTGIIITTNHQSDGIYLPPDDRRHYVAWSELTKEDFDDIYWKDIWSWYERGAHMDVAAYLKTLDISTFNPKAPPPVNASAPHYPRILFWSFRRLGRSSPTPMRRAIAIGRPTAGLSMWRSMWRLV